MRNIFADRSAATVIEFAFLFPIYIVMIFACMEIGWIYIQNSMIKVALEKTSREVYLGNAQHGNWNHQDLINFACTQASVVSSCNRRMSIEVVKIAESADMPGRTAECNPENLFVPAEFNTSIGGSGDLVFMKTCLEIEPLVSAVGSLASSELFEEGRMLLTEATVFFNRVDR